VVGIDPGTVYLPNSFGDAKTRFVDAGALWVEENGRYLHAKAVYIEGFNSQKIFISGSANPSGPGWGLESAAANTEANIGPVHFGFCCDQANHHDPAGLLTQGLDLACQVRAPFR
jgi:hypothetical protein